MRLTVAQIAAATGAEFSGPPSLLNAVVSSWSIDSRTVVPGDLFFAIRGETHDGHAFVPDVMARGALAAVVSEPVGDTEPVLRVGNSVRALQQTARVGRDAISGTVVAVTGSAGKTSSKDIIAALLETRFRVGKTVGNLNNHLGLPLSLLRLPADVEAAVVELGMNHAGEIRALARIALPDIGVVTNVGYAHVEMFADGIAGIAAAKRELVEELGPSGIAILNADDERVRQFRKFHAGRSITYGFSEGADVRVSNVSSNGVVTRFCVGDVTFETWLQGRHSISNILAGVVVAGVLGIATADLVPAVAALRPSGMRGERFSMGDVTVINDSYNSNPEAARAMVDVLEMEPGRRRIAVLGEMRELGTHSQELHRELGQHVAKSKVDVLIGISGDSRVMVERAVECGLDRCHAFFFSDPEQAGFFLRGFVQPGDAVLFKGSRGTHVEKALEQIQNQGACR